MSLSIDHGTTGVKRQSFRRGDARNIVATILRATPRISDDDLLEKIRPIALKNEEFLDIALVYYAAGERRNLTRAPRNDRPVKVPDPKEKALAAAQREEIKQQAVRKITISVLDMMVGDKAIRDYTFGEIGKVSTKFAALSKLGKPNEKVGKLSETAVRKLFR